MTAGGYYEAAAEAATRKGGHRVVVGRWPEPDNGKRQQSGKLKGCAVDAADQQSSRPDFAIAIYPGHLALAKNSIALDPTIKSHITSQTPPTFSCKMRTMTWTASRTR
jgi:hypothetical protein